MEKRKQLKYAFYVADLTSLRYAIPFIKTCNKFLNVDVVLLFNATSTKYNSIAYYRKRFIEIMNENSIEFIDVQQQIHVDVLFCIECVVSPLVNFGMCYAIQHAFDYLYSAPFQKTYLVSEKYFQSFFGPRRVLYPTSRRRIYKR